MHIGFHACYAQIDNHNKNRSTGWSGTFSPTCIVEEKRMGEDEGAGTS
mgnify:CR=1 FL=1